MIRAILFDLDETLIDRRSSAERFLKLQHQDTVLGKFSSTVPEDEYLAAYFRLEKAGFVKKSELYPRLASQIGLSEEAGHLLFDDFEFRYPEIASLMDGAVATLKRLRTEGLACAVITNGEGPVQRRKMVATGLSGLVEFALISGEIGIRKPDRRIFELAATTLGLLPAECLFIGDNPVADVMGATNAGMAAAYFGDWRDWPNELPKPEYRFSTFAEISGALNSLA